MTTKDELKKVLDDERELLVSLGDALGEVRRIFGLGSVGWEKCKYCGKPCPVWCCSDCYSDLHEREIREEDDEENPEEE